MLALLKTLFDILFLKKAMQNKQFANSKFNENEENHI